MVIWWYMVIWYVLRSPARPLARPCIFDASISCSQNPISPEDVIERTGFSINPHIPFNGYSVEGVIQGGTSIATRKHFAHCLSICLLSFLHCREAKMITRVSSIEIHKFGDIEIPASQVTGPHHCKCEATHLKQSLDDPSAPKLSQLHCWLQVGFVMPISMGFVHTKAGYCKKDDFGQPVLVITRADDYGEVTRKIFEHLLQSKRHVRPHLSKSRSGSPARAQSTSPLFQDTDKGLTWPKKKSNFRSMGSTKNSRATRGVACKKSQLLWFQHDLLALLISNLIALLEQSNKSLREGSQDGLSKNTALNPSKKIPHLGFVCCKAHFICPSLQLLSNLHIETCDLSCLREAAVAWDPNSIKNSCQVFLWKMQPSNMLSTCFMLLQALAGRRKERMAKIHSLNQLRAKFVSTELPPLLHFFWISCL